MSTIVNTARGVAALMSGLTGTRATGTVTAKATGSDVEVRPGDYIVPIVEGERRYDLLLKVAKNPNTSNARWTVTAGGTTIDVMSQLGGARQNIPSVSVDPTSCYWDLPLRDGLEETLTLDAPGMVGGADPSGFVSIQQIETYEAVGLPVALDLFRARLSKLPAVAIVWQGSDPGDGATTNAVDKGSSRVGQGQQLFVERFDILIITDRLDSEHLRRQEGLSLADEIVELIVDRTSADGVCISSPSGLTIHGRFRSELGARGDFQQFYIYGIQCSLMRSYSRREHRTFNPWLYTDITAQKPEPNGLTDPSDLQIVSGYQVEMIQDE